MARSEARQGVFSGCGVELDGERLGIGNTTQTGSEGGGPWSMREKLKGPDDCSAESRRGGKRYSWRDGRGTDCTLNYANSKGQPLKDFKQKGEGILSLLLFPEPNPVLKTS